MTIPTDARIEAAAEALFIEASKDRFGKWATVGNTVQNLWRKSATAALAAADRVSQNEIAHLQFCLNSRDDFLGKIGQWQNYVDTLPQGKAGFPGTNWSADRVSAAQDDKATKLVERLRRACEYLRENVTAQVRTYKSGATNGLVLDAADEIERLARISAGKVEGCDQDAIYAAYLGICVLKTMCLKAGLTLGEDRARELLIELGTAFPFISERVGLSALRGPAPPPASEGG